MGSRVVEASADDARVTSALSGKHGTVADEQCWVAKQPEADGELEAMLATMELQEFDCIRYCGTSADVLSRVRSVTGRALVDRAEDVVRVGGDGSA